MVLESVRLRSHFFGWLEVGGDWGLAVGARPSAVFHVQMHGESRLEVDGGGHLLREGDLALLPHGTAHHLLHRPGSTTVPIERLVRDAEAKGERRLRLGHGDASGHLLCGGIEVEDGAQNPLMRALPTVIVVPAAGRCPWLETTLQLIAGEAASKGPGSRAVMLRLADVLLIQCVRHHAEHAPEGMGSWVRGLRDPRIARALLALHRAPGAAWTVDTLAREAGLSRSGFALLFTTLVGESPSAYLTHWRVHVAATLLRERRLSVAEIAHRLGYESEAGFSRAFRRVRGMAPGRFRHAVPALAS